MKIIAHTLGFNSQLLLFHFISDDNVIYEYKMKLIGIDTKTKVATCSLSLDNSSKLDNMSYLNTYSKNLFSINFQLNTFNELFSFYEDMMFQNHKDKYSIKIIYTK